MHNLKDYMIFVCFVIAGFSSYFLLGVKGFIVLIGFMYGAIAISKPRFLLGLYWFVVLWYPYIESVFPSLSGTVKYADEGILLVLGLVLYLHIVRYGTKFTGTRFINSLFIWLVLFAVVSGYANNVPKSNQLRFFATYFRFFLIFYYTLCFFDGTHRNTIYLGFAVTMLSFIVLNFSWLLHFNPLPNPSLGGLDFASGTGVGANNVAYYAIIALTLLASMLNLSMSVKKKMGIVFIALILLAQLLITFTFHAYLVFPLIFGVHWILFVKIRYKWALLTCFVCLGVIVASGMIQHEFSQGGGISDVLNTRYIAGRVRNMRTGIKGQIYKNVVFYAPKQMPYPILGAGPGNFSSSIGMNSRRPLAEQYINYTYLTYSGNMQRRGNSITTYPFAGYVTILGELGWIGSLLFWGIHLYVPIRIWRQLKKNLYQDPWQSIFAQVVFTSMFFYLGLNILLDFANQPFIANGLWILVASVWNPQPAIDSLLAETEEIIAI